MSCVGEGFTDRIKAMSREQLEQFVETLMFEYRSTEAELVQLQGRHAQATSGPTAMLVELRERAARWDAFIRDMERYAPMVRQYTLEQDKLDHMREWVDVWAPWNRSGQTVPASVRTTSTDDVPKRNEPERAYHFHMAISWHRGGFASDRRTYFHAGTVTVQRGTSAASVLRDRHEAICVDLQLTPEECETVVIDSWTLMSDELP